MIGSSFTGSDMAGAGSVSPPSRRADRHSDGLGSPEPKQTHNNPPFRTGQPQAAQPWPYGLPRTLRLHPRDE